VTVAQITLIDPDDLKGAQLTCGNCGVAVVVLAESQIPASCPSCNTQISAGARKALQHFQKFIAEAKHEDTRQRVQLVLSAPSRS